MTKLDRLIFPSFFGINVLIVIIDLQNTVTNEVTNSMIISQ